MTTFVIIAMGTGRRPPGSSALSLQSGYMYRSLGTLFFLWPLFAPKTPPAPQLQSSKSQFGSISVSGSSLLVLSPFLLQDTYPFVQGLHIFQYLSHETSSSGEPTLTLGYLEVLPPRGLLQGSPKKCFSIPTPSSSLQHALPKCWEDQRPKGIRGVEEASILGRMRDNGGSWPEALAGTERGS